MTDRLASTDETALSRFRAHVMADEALALNLWRADAPDRFVELATRSAGALGIDLDAGAVRDEFRPDPLGLARFAPAPLNGSHWPPSQWLPVNVAAQAGAAVIDWALFGPEPLTEPFFEGEARRALRRPFNRLFRYRMTLKDFLADAPRQQSLAPTGFIFHMSRCGSTLVSQMLAAVVRNVVISEAAPIDAVVQLIRASPQLPAVRQDDLLRTIVAAFGRKRTGDEGRYFIKLDSWHALALPLFRRAFPATPFVFLYRDPAEVLVSQMRERGSQMVPQIVPPALYGIEADDMPGEDYCARVLNTICTAAAEHCAEGYGLAVNYRELPEAVERRILPHFGVATSPDEHDAMTRATRNDAKAPGLTFESDADAKRHQPSPAIRALAEARLGDVYRRLEALRDG